MFILFFFVFMCGSDRLTFVVFNAVCFFACFCVYFVLLSTTDPMAILQNNYIMYAVMAGPLKTIYICFFLNLLRETPSQSVNKPTLLKFCTCSPSYMYLKVTPSRFYIVQQLCNASSSCNRKHGLN